MTSDPDDERGKAQSENYARGWAEIGRAIEQGESWSGRERNVAYLNTGDGRFADVSSVSGLDYPQDGRAVAEVDWDHDGDLDLWFRNRSGPALRLMQNQMAPERFIALLLEGRESNRDAIGASVSIRTSERVLRRDRAAGDGYLSQSSRWLHFGLGAKEQVQRIDVRWPGGATESFEQVALDRRYRLVQSSGKLEPLSLPRHEIAAAAIELPPTPRVQALVLKDPLPLPPGFLKASASTPIAGRSRFVSFWAHWCKPCLDELSDLSAVYPTIKSAGIDIVPLNVDEAEAQAEAAQVYQQYVIDRAPASPFRTQRASGDQRKLIETLLAEITAREGELRLPTSLLIDPLGQLQVVYFGAVDGERLLEDHRRFIRHRANPAERGFYPGRWYFKTPRAFGTLAGKLKKQGLPTAARFYLGLDHFRTPGPRAETP